MRKLPSATEQHRDEGMVQQKTTSGIIHWVD